MLRLASILKNYRETGSLNEQVNLYGFIHPQVFLTKTGEVGVFMEVEGVDFECLDSTSIDVLTKRLESALRLFDENFRFYQMLFKRAGATIPFELCGNPVVDTAIRNRIAYLQSKTQNLFTVAVYFAVLYQGRPATRKLVGALTALPTKPTEAFRDLRAHFSTAQRVLVLGHDLDKAQDVLLEKTRSFLLQVNDFLAVRILDKDEAFRVFKRMLNFQPGKIELARLKYDTFLDYYLSESSVECHRENLRVDDYYVKVLTLKEPPAQSFPLILQRLFDVEASYHVVTEWKKENSGSIRREIQARRRHFHNTKRSFASQMSLSDAPAHGVLLDDSKEARVHELGDAIREMELHGNYFGRFSLTVVVYDLDPAKVERACAEFYKVFSVHDAQLYEERYNLLNAFLASVPGNYNHNLRYLYLLNTNYADLSFLFTLRTGQPRNEHLRQEYLAVLETNHRTPYYLNLHYRDVAHTMILGRTGSGKSFLLNFLITNLQKYAPRTFIFDLGGSFESLTQLFEGSYVRVGLDSPNFKINPFSLPPTKENLDFLTLFVKVLAQGTGSDDLPTSAERDLYGPIENLYAVEPSLRTLGVLADTLPHALSDRLSKWTRGGQFGFLFDNAEDTISFSAFQCFDFQHMGQYPELMQPLLFYILHRANAVVADPGSGPVLKAFFVDEAWVFLKNPSIQRYVVQALKTWRKHNAAMILSTQSLDELKRSEILDIVVESCATKIFLANPDTDRDLYRRQFHLNENEVERIAGLVPKQQFLIKTPELAKVVNLNVDPKSYWLYTNDPYDNQKRKHAFDAYGFEQGLELLAAEAR